MRAGWKIKTLGEVCEIFDRKRKPISKRDREPGPYPYYGASCIQDYVSGYLFDGRYLLIGEDGAKWGPGEDTAYIAEGKFWVNNHAHIVKAKEGYLDDFLRYYIKHLDLNPIVAGAIIPKLTQEKLATLEVPIPSLTEQQRIADILDREFAKIDALKANAEKSLQAAKDIFQATLKKELEPRRDMRTVALGDIISFERGLTYAKGDEVAYSSVGVLRSNNVDLTTQSLNLDEIKYLREDFEVPSKKKVRKSSLLMCMSNGSKDHLGKVALIDRKLDYAFGGFMGLLTPDEAKVFPKYLYYALASKSFKDYIHSLADGANINNLKYKDLSIFRVTLPSLAEQELSVSRLDDLNGRCKSLQQNYQKTLSLCDDLKQSLLRKAFNGEL